MPFLFAVALGLALLPVQATPVDPVRLGISLVMIFALFGITVAYDWRDRPLPSWLLLLLPYLFLVAVALLRAGTGGTRSGYAALLFLVPFWVALNDRRRPQVVLVTLAMFAALAFQGLIEEDFSTLSPLRGALLTTVVIGMISLAVNRNVFQLRSAQEELRATNTALERSNRELEQFAYVSSHDLQEPLRMIRSFSQLFMQRHADQVDEEGLELLGYVTGGAERAQLLVADLLEYSRVGSSTRAFVPVALDGALDGAISTLGPMIEESGATIERETSLPTVTGDRVQLERLFVNLVSNAIRYAHADRAPVIRIAAREVGDAWDVSVSDNGIGFDVEHAARIFQMFQRLHARDEYAGTGMGLAICERIVDRHGGRIRASGVPGVGSTFTFTLEAAP